MSALNQAEEYASMEKIIHTYEILQILADAR